MLPTATPLSILNEMAQQGQVFDQGFSSVQAADLQWVTRASARNRRGHRFVVKTTGKTIKQAKQEAARMLIEYFASEDDGSYIDPRSTTQDAHPRIGVLPPRPVFIAPAAGLSAESVVSDETLSSDEDGRISSPQKVPLYFPRVQRLRYGHTLTDTQEECMKNMDILSLDFESLAKLVDLSITCRSY